jgi:hypothetical protein
MFRNILVAVDGSGGLLAYLRLRPRLMRGGAPIRTELRPPSETLAREQPRHLRTRTDAETDPLIAGRRRSSPVGKCPTSKGSSVNAPRCAAGTTSRRARLNDRRGER